MAQVFPNTIDDLRKRDCILVTLREGRKAKLSFSTNADFEQGVCIYGPTGFKYAERRSTGNFEDLILPNDPNIGDTDYIITGWHWFPMTGGAIWAQSRQKIEGGSPEYKLGFDDSIGDGDFDDLVVTLNFMSSMDGTGATDNTKDPEPKPLE